MINTAIVYHYFAHYRQPILSEMAKSKAINYTFISGNVSEIEIKKIDPLLAKTTKGKGGLNWILLKNIWIKNKFLWQVGLCSILIKNKYDSVIFLGNPYFISTWLGVLICRMKGVKVYFWMHGFYKSRISPPDYIKLYVFYKMANGFFLYGNRAFKRLLDLKIKQADEMHIIYNSLDYDKGLPLRNKLNLSNSTMFRELHFENSEMPVVCFIGRINKTKKLDLLIDAQKQNIKETGKPLFNALIIGNGEELENLQSKVKNELALNQRCFKFMGAVYDEEHIANLIMYSDLCITPGEVGLTAMHSLMYGTPVISHDNFDLQMPEVEAIKKGSTGDFFKYENIDDLRKVITNWFQQYPTKTEQLINCCYKVIDDNYNPHVQKNIFDNVLLEK